MIRKDAHAPASGHRLNAEQRVEIRIGLERGWSLRRIGAELGRAPSTISREVAANGGIDGYRPMAADARARGRAQRP